MVGAVAGSEDPFWKILRKGLHGGHEVSEHSRTVPATCSSAARSHDTGSDSQQQLLMSMRPSAVSPIFLIGVL